MKRFYKYKEKGEICNHEFPEKNLVGREIWIIKLRNLQI